MVYRMGGDGWSTRWMVRDVLQDGWRALIYMMEGRWLFYRMGG
jgi:hypothetical protein